MPTQLPDVDPQETREWIESLDAVVQREGRQRARYLLLRVLERAREQQVGVPHLRSTDYINTIPPDREPPFPGDEYIERRIRAYIRWNAAVMVSRANRPDIGVGGHIATYASSASLYEVGFNHFFRGKGTSDDPRHGDQIFFQGHASPGIYARAYLEGRLSEEHLDLFRQETRRTSDGRAGLPSYPHPRLMPHFWEFPTVSMGLGPINSIYQARFNRYLHHRGIADTGDSRVWAFVGDGEMDEPESQGALTVAAREELDNLIWVVNCNLQRLDGPVRGNGKIIQEMESLFRGAGWNVIKVVWGRKWDELLALDTTGALVSKMNATPDGQFQTYSVSDAAYIREHFFDSPELRRILEQSSLTEADLPVLDRGGHDYGKVYAAYEAAVNHAGQPTVILAQTIKGWTLGPDFEARNATHQMKKLTQKALKKFRDRLYLDIPDEALESDLPPYYHPGEDSDEIQYMLERRLELGGPLPARRVRVHPVSLPERDAYAELKQGSGKHDVATTMAFVRLLKDLLKHPDLGKRIVPIIPDEARTFGMDAMFPTEKIYSPHGQTYEPVDREMLLAYRESTQGQILHEGITEAGSMASFHAAGSAYATFSEHMLPVYVFYSMFGFQRTADLIWSAADQRCKGFLIGATAGRTTLNGEGLQHEDGHSLLYAATNPAVVSYDPSFAYEIAVVVEDGINRMLGNQADPDGPASSSEAVGHGADLMYYLTVYNEPVPQPPMPDGLDERLVLRGLYRYLEAPDGDGPLARVLTSGSAMPAALRARDLLAEDWGVRTEVWSAPGWVQLHREGVACDEWNLLHPEEEPRVPWVTEALRGAGDAPVIAVTDYQKAVPLLVAPWVPAPYHVLGTDGFGRSDLRSALRRLFRIDAEHVALAALHELAKQGAVEAKLVREAVERYGIDPDATTELP
ncbi:MAG TPA: pyruvate dehydrogenase (acetyl-transferring), homodimeric type [Egibacteraceae bacterium]|nr:pyruvate dehydrogenase (acetyl-transferring), homodimeric type [Egibacteraceae bacterium]